MFKEEDENTKNEFGDNEPGTQNPTVQPSPDVTRPCKDEPGRDK
jgi:hypothetical protein